MKENSGPGQSRNYGAERSEGEYLLILDSDVVLPENYLYAIEEELHRDKADAFGGPDRAHNSFTDTQKAISYSMTSFFTTGGIRGGKKKMDKFYPRSFNMGIRREVYNKLGGFSKMRFGEDIDFSIRIFKAGCKCRLFPGAWVYHKRRTDFRKFWRQWNCSHQPIQEISREFETRASTPYGIHCGSWHLLHIGYDWCHYQSPPTHCLGTATTIIVFSTYLYRFKHTEQEHQDWHTQHSCRLHSANGLRLWLYRSMVETLCSR